MATNEFGIEHKLYCRTCIFKSVCEHVGSTDESVLLGCFIIDINNPFILVKTTNNGAIRVFQKHEIKELGIRIDKDKIIVKKEYRKPRRWVKPK